MRNARCQTGLNFGERSKFAVATFLSLVRAVSANKPRPAPQTGTAGKQTDGGSVHCIANFVAGVEEAVEGRLD